MDYHRRLREIANVKFCADPQSAIAAANYLQGLRAQIYEDGMRRALFQAAPGRGLVADIYDAHFFGLLWDALLAGDIAWTAFGIKQGPHENAEKQRNNAILADFSGSKRAEDRVVEVKANFDPDGKNGDGDFSWSTPLILQRNTTEGSPSHVVVPPSVLPLEVGSTEVTTTYRHIWMGARGVARWPYGSELVYVFVPVTPNQLLEDLDRATGYALEQAAAEIAAQSFSRHSETDR